MDTRRLTWPVSSLQSHSFAVPASHGILLAEMLGTMGFYAFDGIIVCITDGFKDGRRVFHASSAMLLKRLFSDTLALSIIGIGSTISERKCVFVEVMSLLLYSVA